MFAILQHTKNIDQRCKKYINWVIDFFKKLFCREIFFTRKIAWPFSKYRVVVNSFITDQTFYRQTPECSLKLKKNYFILMLSHPNLIK